jgi:hypothetical protein
VKLRQLYEAPARKVVAVMPGGFHPFHPGHKSLYDWAVKQFGQTNVYVAATNNQETRPFPFDVKKQLASFAGVPPTNFIQVKSPFNLNSYTGLLQDGTALVFVRSEKDRNEQPQPDRTKKDGTPGYIKSWTGKEMDDYVTSGYMAYGPTQEFQFSGVDIKSASELRNTWPSMSPKDRRKAAEEMYPSKGIEAAKLLDNALGSEQEESVQEWVLPAIKGSKYAFKIGKWLWNNKWALAWFAAAWKTIDWIGDALDWIQKFFNHPVTKALTKYGLPAIGIAIALYGGKRLWDELENIKDERELDKMVRSFVPNPQEVEKELELAMAEDEVNELNLFKRDNNTDPKRQDPNKLKVLDWVSSRNDGKEHFLSFFVKGAAWSGRLLFIKPDAAKAFMKKVEDNPEHADRIKKALTSIETTSKLFTNLKIDHQVRRAS